MKKGVTERGVILSYKRELQVLGYAKMTVFRKVRAVLNFKAFINKNYLLIEEKEIEIYVDYLHKTKGLHSCTIEHYYHDLEQFYLYLERENILLKNPFNYYKLSILKESKTARSIVNQEEIRELYQVVKTEKERILLHLSYGCGLRAKELERVNIEDVLIIEKLLKVEKGKNNKHRVIPLAASMVKDFRVYLEWRLDEKVQTQSLLLNERGNRLRAYTARTILQKVLKRTTIIKPITLHSLRHSIATHLLENGMKAEQVQHFLGHKQLETTEIYTRVSQAQLKKLQ